MKKHLKKLLFSVFSSLAVGFSGVAAASWRTVSAETGATPISSVLTASEGLTVTYNVSGSEKVSSLVKDTRKGVHFSAKQSGNAAEGNSVSFNNTLSGLFEMDFRVYTQNKANVTYGGGEWYAGNDAEEIREVAITLTDTDENESFTLYIKGGSPWTQHIPNARVAYGDAGVNYGTGIRYGASDGNDYDTTTTPYDGGKLASTEYNTQMKGTSFTNWYLHSSVVGFDPITKEVYTYAFKSSANESQYTDVFNRRVILDLDNVDHLGYAGTGANELLSCAFNNYTVKFTLTDVTGADETGSQGKDEPANFIIYSLNGQSLGGNGNLTSNVAPGLSATVESGSQYAEYTIPTPTVQSVLGEKTVFSGNVKVLDPNGETVLANQAFSAGLSFTPQALGEYKIVYSGLKDGAGNVRKALTADGTYNGAEIVYTYPLTVGKGLKVAAQANELIQTNGLDVTYNKSGSDMQADLIRDVNKGILFTSQQTGANASGASVTFKNTLSGTMELNFRAYSEVTDSSSSWFDSGDWHNRNNAEEIREMAITITDKETGESFTVYIKGGTSYVAMTPNARVAYGDVGENYGSGRWYKPTANGFVYNKDPDKGLSSASYNTELVGTSFTNRAKNAGGWIGGGYSTCIGFDPVTKIVYGYTYGSGSSVLEKRPILDLDDEEDMQYLQMSSAGGNVNAGLPQSFKDSTFVNYTVKVTLTDVTEDKTANFLIYHINGQSLGGANGNLCEAGGYTMYLPECEPKFVGMKTSLPTPYASSVLTGAKPFAGTVEVVDEEGNVVLEKQAYSESVNFIPQKAGVYTAYYGGMTDENGFVKLQFNMGNYDGEEDRFAYQFQVKEQALELPSYDYVMKKMNVAVGVQSYSSEVDIYLTIEKSGAVYGGINDVKIHAGYVYAFQDTGEYTLIYTVRNSVGGEAQYQTSVKVVAMYGYINHENATVALSDDCVWDKDDFTLYYCDEGAIDDYSVYAEIYNGTAWIPVTDTAGESVNLKDALLALGEGNWKLRFTLIKGADSIKLETTLTAVDCYGPQISVGELNENMIPVPEQDEEGVKYFVTHKGATIQIPTATAMDNVDGATAVTILLKTPASSTGESVQAEQTITFDTDGTYLLVYKSVDNAGNVKTLAYSITVKSLWLNITKDLGVAEFGETIVLPKPDVVNSFTGETVSEFEWTAKMYFNGEEVEKIGNGYQPLYVGEYEVVYAVIYQNATQNQTLFLSVEDTIKPVLTVDGAYTAEVQVGDVITVLEAKIEDESVCNLVISVVCNGAARVQISEDNTFVADKAGTYVVKYTATDVSGNTSSVEFTFTVNEISQGGSGCSGSLESTLSVCAVLMLLGGAVLLRKKEN